MEATSTQLPRVSTLLTAGSKDKKFRTHYFYPIYNMTKKAIILNLSGHRLPQDCFQYLKDSGYKWYSMFSQSVHFDYDANLWSQVEDMFLALKETKDFNGNSLYDVEGDIFLSLPSHGTPAALVYEAVTSLFGIPPVLFVIARTGVNQYKLKETIDMRPYSAKWRSYWRAQYILKTESGELDVQIAAKRNSTAKSQGEMEDVSAGQSA